MPKKTIIAIVITLTIIVSIVIRPYLRPPAPAITAVMQGYAQQVEILRDNWGVPHIKASSNNAAAFGLAYAHSEDDYPLIQANLVAARGKLSLLEVSELALANDYLVELLGIPEKVQRQYQQLPEHFKAFLSAYAEGVNYYAALHPEEVDTRFFPVSPEDIVGGFVHKLPLMMGVGGVIQDIYGRDADQLTVGTLIQKRLISTTPYPQWTLGQLAGSNAHAIHASRSSDGVTRLNINSHQPWEGPVTWYEAHIMTDEGWNMTGGTFPGSPFILHGYNQTLGWAHTVNRPDFTDVYKLTVRDVDGLQYLLDEQWLPLTESDATIEIDLSVFTLPVKRAIYASAHGPVIEKDGEYFAIRYAGFDSHGLAALQWYEMNMATNFDEWQQAMQRQGLAMMNTVYADKDNIYYVYNALLPLRKEGVDWLTILPGDDSSLIWNDYLPYQELPQVLNPQSAWVMNTNNTPFQSTGSGENPSQKKFSETFGIETHMNNRAIRSYELFGSDGEITKDEFIRYKFDRKYSKRSSMYQTVLNPLFESFQPETEEQKHALKLLQQWDGEMANDSAAASLAKLTFQPIHRARIFMPLGTEVPTPESSFIEAVDFLLKNYDSVEVPLSELQKLRRGDVELGIGGGTDTLNAVHTEYDGKHFVGKQGDSYIAIVDFTSAGATAQTIHQYGNVNRKDSPHYADQAPLFVKRQLREALLDEDTIRVHLSKAYHPGQE